MSAQRRIPLLCFATVCILLPGAGCRSLTAVTSGHIGCPEHEIRILNKKSGWSTVTWSASCRGRLFHCFGASGGKGRAPHFSCKEEPSTAGRPSAPRRMGCYYDTQCKGGRICQGGRCVYPTRGKAASSHTPRPRRLPPSTTTPLRPTATSTFLVERLGIRIGDARLHAKALGLTASSGAVVLVVQSGGAAHRRHIARGDVILQISSTRIRNADDVKRVARTLKPGQKFRIVVQRKAKNFAFTMQY